MEHDAPFFFGREREREIITTNLIASRLTLLYGASGVGKSSVLHAGVVHHLRLQAHENIDRYATPEFAVVLFNSWRDNPVSALNTCLDRSLEGLLQTRTNEPITANGGGLAETIEGWSTRLNCDLLIILDQFEEYFLYHPQEDGEHTFTAEFSRAVNRADLRANFLVAIREDELAKLDHFKGHIPKLFDSYLRIEHLTRDAARDAIEKPIEHYNSLLAPGTAGVTIEPELVEAVLDQVRTGKVTLERRGGAQLALATDPAEGRIETPYLQMVMDRLWTEEAISGCLRRATLARLGEAERIVSTHLDATMAALPAAEQETAGEIFHYLVTPSGTKIAHSVSDLAEYTKVPPERIMPVLTRLSDGDVRILRPVPSALNRPDAPRFEIFHDVLAHAILDWRARYAANRERAKQEQRLIEERAEAQRKLDLERAEAQQKLEQERTKHEAALAQTRVEAERQRADAALALAGSERGARVRQRNYMIALAIALVAAVGGLLLAVNQYREASRLQAEARARELAAHAISELPNDPELSLKLAQAASLMANAPEIDDALRQALATFRVLTRWTTGPAKITMAAFSPDARLLVTAENSGQAALWDVDRGVRIATLAGHTTSLNSVAFTRDGARVVTASDDGTAQVWETKSGNLLARLKGHTAAVVSAEFSPDGKTIVTASADHTARVWDATTGRQMLPSLEGHSEPLRSATFSRDGTRVVTASLDKTARIWDVRAGKLPVVLHGHDEEVTTAGFSVDDTRVVTTSVDGTVRVWDSISGRTLAMVRARARGARVVVSGDGGLMFTVGADGVAEIWNLKALESMGTLRGPVEDVATAVFSPDGEALLTTDFDGGTRVWDVASRSSVAELRGHNDAVLNATFSSDGRHVVTATRDGAVYTWIASGLDRLVDLHGHTAAVTSAAFGPDGKLLLTTSGDGTAKIWETMSSRPQVTLNGPTNSPLTSGVFSSDGTRVLTIGVDGTTRLWNARSGVQQTIWEGHAGEVRSADFSRDGKWVVTADADHTARVRDTSTGAMTELRGHKDWLSIATFSPDGTHVLTASADCTARVWETSTGKWIPLSGHTDILLGGAFSPDGASVVTVSQDKTARIWNARTGESRRVLAGHTDSLVSAAFSPDGGRVVTASLDRTARVWQVLDESPPIELRGHQDVVSSAVFSPDGNWVLTTSTDQTARLWNAATGRSILELRGHGPLTGAAFSPDGALVVTTDNDGSVQIYTCEMCRSHQNLPQLAAKRVTRDFTTREREKYYLSDTDK